MKDKFYLAMAGNIGAGKTTLTRMIAEHYHWEKYFEPVVENPYLDPFYTDMPRWAFHLQIYFLAKRFQSLLDISRNPHSVVQDRTIYEDVEIFASTLHRQGNMTDVDYQTYKDLFHDMVSFIAPPDLVIYLRTRPEVLVQRIMQRGRDSERNIPIGYLDQLNNAYESWITRYAVGHHVLIIDSELYDPTENNDIMDIIDESVKSLITTDH